MYVACIFLCMNRSNERTTERKNVVHLKINNSSMRSNYPRQLSAVITLIARMYAHFRLNCTDEKLRTSNNCLHLHLFMDPSLLFGAMQCGAKEKGGEREIKSDCRHKNNQNAVKRPIKLCTLKHFHCIKNLFIQYLLFSVFIHLFYLFLAIHRFKLIQCYMRIEYHFIHSSSRSRH